MVKELQGGAAGLAVDWPMTDYRQGKQPETTDTVGCFVKSVELSRITKAVGGMWGTVENTKA